MAPIVPPMVYWHLVCIYYDVTTMNMNVQPIVYQLKIIIRLMCIYYCAYKAKTVCILLILMCRYCVVTYCAVTHSVLCYWCISNTVQLLTSFATTRGRPTLYIIAYIRWYTKYIITLCCSQLHSSVTRVRRGSNLNHEFHIWF